MNIWYALCLPRRGFRVHYSIGANVNQRRIGPQAQGRIQAIVDHDSRRSGAYPNLDY